MSYTEIETNAFQIVPPAAHIKVLDPPAAKSPIDVTMLNLLEDMQGLDEPNLVVELIDLYLEDAKLNLEKIEAAIVRRDLHQLKQAAHSLKGSSSSLGANQLAGWCHLLEMFESMNDWTKVPKIFVNLQRSAVEACDYLARERDRRS
ncbi:MAG: Hpt domain-containing protein [Pyrinomonadaceae bacterium]